MKRKKILAAIMAVMIIAAAGCGASNPEYGSEDTKESESMDYNNIKMTDKEMELLCVNYPFDEDSIRKGVLSETQYRALRELRLATDLIDTKYPGLEYDIVLYLPVSKMRTQGLVDIRIEGEGEKSYVAYINYDENGKNPYALETVYGYELRDAYDSYICSLLEENGIQAKSYTNFLTPVAHEVGRGTYPEDIIDRGSEISRCTDIFIEDTGDKESAAGKIREIMENNRIYAVYEVNFVPSTEAEAKDLEAGRRNYESITFECAE